jgi:hypothetical protein
LNRSNYIAFFRLALHLLGVVLKTIEEIAVNPPEEEARAVYYMLFLFEYLKLHIDHTHR